MPAKCADMQSAVDVALSVFDVALWRTALVVLLTCVPTRPVAGQQHAEAVRQGAVRVIAGSLVSHLLQNLSR